MRTVQVIDHLKGGGQERVAVVLANSLASRIESSGLLVTRESGDYEKRLTPPVNLFVMKRRRRLTILPWLRALNWLRTQNFALVHTHGTGSMANVGLMKRMGLIRLPFIVHIQMLPAADGPYTDRILRWVSLLEDAIDAVVVTTDDIAAKVVTASSRLESRMHVIFNPVNFGEYSSPVRFRTDQADAPPRVVMVAQWRPQKNQLALIRASGFLQQWNIAHTIDFVGAFEDAASVEAARNEVARLGLERTVRFMGRREDIPSLLRGASVGVLSTHYEGQPVAVIEYAAAGLPSIVSIVAGTESVISPGHGIIGVMPDNPQALARAIASLLSERGRATEQGIRAREWMRNRADVASVSHQLIGVYEAVRLRHTSWAL